MLRCVMWKKGSFTFQIRTAGFIIMAVGGMFGAIFQDFKVGMFIIAAGGLIAAFADLVG